MRKPKDSVDDERNARPDSPSDAERLFGRELPSRDKDQWLMTSTEIVLGYYTQPSVPMAEHHRLLSRLAAMEHWIAQIRQTGAFLPSDPPAPSEGADDRSVYDKVIENLNKRIVPQPIRNDIRESLDKADRALTGRPGADEALKRISGR
jgi:hypothetical protein